MDMVEWRSHSREDTAATGLCFITFNPDGGKLEGEKIALAMRCFSEITEENLDKHLQPVMARSSGAAAYAHTFRPELKHSSNRLRLGR